MCCLFSSLGFRGCGRYAMSYIKLGMYYHPYASRAAQNAVLTRRCGFGLCACAACASIVVLDVCMQILTCESRISQKSYVLPCWILAFSKARTEKPIWFNESPHPITPEFVWPVCVQPWSSGPPTAIGTFTVYDPTCRRRLSIAREAGCLPFTTDCVGSRPRDP